MSVCGSIVLSPLCCPSIIMGQHCLTHIILRLIIKLFTLRCELLKQWNTVRTLEAAG